MIENPPSGRRGAAPPEVKGSLDLLFRRRAGQLAATLTRILGIENLDLVDDVVQDAFVQALKKWPYTGVPENPGGWVIQVAKNRAVDILRRQGRWREKRDELKHSILPRLDAGRVFFSDELDDDQLRMMFACCHPALSRDAQVALTLKAVGGFSVNEIARAFLTRKPTIAQRLVRAKRTLRDKQVSLEMPATEELPAHIDSVLEVLYLMFNEGYSASAGDDLVRADLCDEAVRLVELVAMHPVVGGPRVHALAALFLFQAARLPTRVDGDGELLLLDQQDRSLWDRALLRRALKHFRLAARGEQVSAYHLQAEIASYHALAESFDATDWAEILRRYDQLLQLDPSPVVALNRVVALTKVEGPDAGLQALDALREEPALQTYYHLFAIEGDLHSRLGRKREAKAALSKAIPLARSQPVRRYLERRVRNLETEDTAASFELVDLAPFQSSTNRG
jgi:RNA polymerase sigma-70 factor (ECF subfamily)